jgi:hypothetical protein
MFALREREEQVWYVQAQIQAHPQYIPLFSTQQDAEDFRRNYIVEYLRYEIVEVGYLKEV